MTYMSTLTLLLLIFLQITGCNKGQKPDKPQARRTDTKKSEISAIVNPQNSEVFKCGESLPVKLFFRNKDVTIDSVVLTSGSYFSATYDRNYDKIFWLTANAPVGQNVLRVTTYYNDTLKENQSVVVTLLSDLIPKLYKYRLINTYPHDVNAYTQGLIYDNGTLLESTGQNGKSSLRRVKIETGEVLKMVSLDAKFFGEGIAMIEDKIFQLTWKSQTGFVYNKNTFEVLRTFNFPYYEGWGLTSKENDIYMSDGSSYIYVIEPEFFTQKRQIDVYNHKGRINQLNELEWVNGKILANVLGETYILIIDPNNGKVTGEIELKNLVPKGFEKDMNKVMNGIAFNKETNRLYVTGKLWPVLYEIEIEENL